MAERYISKQEIDALDKIHRINLINSITGIKPANLIGTKDSDGSTNLAIFSSVVHMGSKPPLIGMVSRPSGEVERHTIENIMKNRHYTINHVPISHAKNAHYTSAKLEKGTSEFDACGFLPSYVEDFGAPFVKESAIKFGLEYRESIPIELNGTVLIIGEITHILIEEDCISQEYYIDLQKSSTAGVSGLNSYYNLQYVDSYPYARPEDIQEALSKHDRDPHS